MTESRNQSSGLDRLAHNALLQALRSAAFAFGDDLALQCAAVDRPPALVARAQPRPAEATQPTAPRATPPRSPAALPAGRPGGAPSPGRTSAGRQRPEISQPSGDATADLATMAAELSACQACKLCEQRTQVVFGEGAAQARVMFVGEAPGRDEDRQGRPFVGKSGQLLDRIISGGMGLQRDEVYIANVNKCRPPNNRNPEPDEVAACLPFLRQQVRIVQPDVLVALGRVAAQNLLSTTRPMRLLRGRELDYEGTPVVATWHPAYLLRKPEAKAETWEDIKRVNRLLGNPEVPDRKPG